jgi:hypothetical protein
MSEEKIKRVSEVLITVREHLIMNDMDVDRISELMREVTYPYFCHECGKDLYPINLDEVLKGEAACVYVHEDVAHNE